MSRYIVPILCLLACSAFFSATETAFTSLNRIKMKNMANDDVANAKLVLALEGKYDKLLSTILIGNNIANIAMTAVATVMFTEILGGSLGPTVSTVVMTAIVLIFGEISPKNLGKEKSESIALLSAPIMRVIILLFTPLNLFFSAWKKLLGKVFGIKEGSSFTEDELITIVEEAQIGGNIGKEQQELITNAIEFDDLEAIDIITPRVDVEAIEVDSSLEEIADIFKKSGFSRLPVYDGDLDNIVGVINQKDFHNYVLGDGRKLENYIKPVAYVAESMKAAVLLKKMQAKKTHIAIIVDEYGGTTGLVTMEDIIEELVGKIYDEHDAIEMRDVTQLYDGTYSVSGGANVEKFFEMVGEDIDVDATTVNGWVMIELDRLAKVGDMFDYRSKHKIFHVRVTRADERRALMVHIRVENIPDEDE